MIFSQASASSADFARSCAYPSASLQKSEGLKKDVQSVEGRKDEPNEPRDEPRDEPMDEPPVRLKQALKQSDIPQDRFFVMQHGETRSLNFIEN